MARTIEYERPHLYQKQSEAIFDPRRYSLIEASTKAGKTAGCIAWLAEQAIIAGRPGRNFWWVAPVYPQARIAFTRLRRGLPRGVYTANETELRLTLINGAVIWFKSGEKPDNLYGEDVYAAVIDEASRMREEAWYALRSTLTATSAPVRIIGNVKGRRNWFYALARRAEAGDPNMGYHRMTASDAIAAGIFDASELADAQATMPEHVFRELYFAEPSDDGGNPFGLDPIRACIRPLADTDPAAWGWDLAKSIDWTVGIGLDTSGATCRIERWQRPWNETVDAIRGHVGTTPALIDSTGVGDPVLEQLQRDGRRNFEGFKFATTSKQQLMEGLAVAIQQGEITFPDGPIVLELEQFEYEYTRTGVRYSAPAGAHDDCVMALALAVRHLEGRRRRVITGAWVA